MSLPDAPYPLQNKPFKVKVIRQAQEMREASQKVFPVLFVHNRRCQRIQRPLAGFGERRGGTE